jgi:hypothetical protein
MNKSTLDDLDVTCMYSIGVSSPGSRFAVYRVAGKAFGMRFNKTRFLEFVIVTDAIVTVADILVSALIIQSDNGGPETNGRIHTPGLVLEIETPRVFQTASNIPHGESVALCDRR